MCHTVTSTPASISEESSDIGEKSLVIDDESLVIDDESSAIDEESSAFGEESSVTSEESSVIGERQPSPAATCQYHFPDLQLSGLDELLDEEQLSQNFFSAEPAHDDVPLIFEGENLDARITELPIADDSATAGGAIHGDDVSEDSPTTPFTEADFDPLIGGSGSQPIFPGATCTKGQLVALMLSFHLRFLHSKESLQALIELFTTVVPDCMRSTKYFFERYFFEGTKGLNIHYICPNCHEYLGCEESNRCDTCNVSHTAKECVKAGAFFITKSMESQLKNLFELGSVLPFIERTNTRKHDFGEIVTGQMYKSS
jgi:hypothetical protein